MVTNLSKRNCIITNSSNHHYHSPHMRLAMVPDGTYSAASFSSSIATFSSRAVGNEITMEFRKSLVQRSTLRVLYISHPVETVPVSVELDTKDFNYDSNSRIL